MQLRKFQATSASSSALLPRQAEPSEVSQPSSKAPNNYLKADMS